MELITPEANSAMLYAAIPSLPHVIEGPNGLTVTVAEAYFHKGRHLAVEVTATRPVVGNVTTLDLPYIFVNPPITVADETSPSPLRSLEALVLETVQAQG